MDHDLSSGIQPPDIIGCRPVHFNHRIGKSHGTNALTGLAHYFYVDRFISGPPQSPADAVLTVSFDSQVPVSLFDRRLNLFFNNPRINPFSGNSAGNNVKGRFVNCILVRHFRSPITEIENFCFYYLKPRIPTQYILISNRIRWLTALNIFLLPET
jgi:hypothetical protein